jgi:hypothetical protein
VTDREATVTLVLVHHGRERIGLDAGRVLAVEDPPLPDDRDIGALLGLPPVNDQDVTLTIKAASGRMRLRTGRPQLVEVPASAIVAVPALSARSSARCLTGLVLGDLGPILVLDPDLFAPDGAP